MCAWGLCCETDIEVMLPFATTLNKLPWYGPQIDPS